MKRLTLLLCLLCSLCSAQVETGGLRIPGDDAVNVVKKSGAFYPDTVPNCIFAAAWDTYQGFATGETAYFVDRIPAGSPRLDFRQSTEARKPVLSTDTKTITFGGAGWTAFIATDTSDLAKFESGYTVIARAAVLGANGGNDMWSRFNPSSPYQGYSLPYTVYNSAVGQNGEINYYYSPPGGYPFTAAAWPISGQGYVNIAFRHDAVNIDVWSGNAITQRRSAEFTTGAVSGSVVSWGKDSNSSTSRYSKMSFKCFYVFNRAILDSEIRNINDYMTRVYP